MAESGKEARRTNKLPSGGRPEATGADRRPKQDNNCWAVRLCTSCPASISTGIGSEAERFADFCDGTRSMWRAVLGRIVTTLERNPRAFDWIDEVAFG